jgi:hypothetical protein
MAQGLPDGGGIGALAKLLRVSPLALKTATKPHR